MFFTKGKDHGHTYFCWRKYDSPIGGEFVCGWHAPCFEYSRSWGSGDCPKERYGMLMISIGWGKLYLRIPNNFVPTSEHNYEGPTYGFYTYPYQSKHIDSIWLMLGYKSKVIRFPWSYDWVRTSHLLDDGTWYNDLRSDKVRRRKKGDYSVSLSYYDDPRAWKETYEYTYVLKNGTAQKRKATVYVTEREWRPIWFRWTKLFSSTKRGIEVEFDGEVGEETGTWKGGAISCGYDMKEIIAVDPHTGHRVKRFETPEECLRRMESERNF